MILFSDKHMKKFWRPLHLQPCIKKKGFVKPQINTKKIWGKMVILPSSFNLKQKQLKYIQNTLKIFSVHKSSQLSY